MFLIILLIFWDLLDRWHNFLPLWENISESCIIVFFRYNKLCFKKVKVNIMASSGTLK